MTTPEERVRALIGRSRLSQGEFASRIGLDPPKLSKSLSRVRRFTSLELARVAELGEVSVDWILTGDEPAVATAARAQRGSSASRALQEAADIVELRESASRLGSPQHWAPLPSLSGRWRAYEQGARLAEAALGRLSELGLDPVTMDLAGLVETAFGADVCLAALGEGFDGLAAATADARVIVAGVTALPYRQRFTIAHELGHLLAGDDQGVHADADVMAPTRDPSEMRANAFAAALLMPEPMLRERVHAGFGEPDFARLAVTLMVTPSALAFRLADLRLIDDMTRDRWRGMSAQAAARAAGLSSALAEHAAYSCGLRRPAALARDLYAAYVDGRATGRLYARLLGIPPESLEDPGDPGDLPAGE